MSNQELAHAVLGAVGGALALGITYPLITLSTIAQTAAKRRKQKKQAPPRMVKPQPTVSLTTLEKSLMLSKITLLILLLKKFLKKKVHWDYILGWKVHYMGSL